MNIKYARRSETTEQIQVIQWSKAYQIQWSKAYQIKYPELKWLFHIPNEGKRTPQEKIKLTQLGLKPGVSDLLLPFPRGHYGNLYIEMKFGPGTLQPEQKEFLKAMTAAGHYTCVCYTARDATETIETYLNLKWDEEMPNPPYGILKEGEPKGSRREKKEMPYISQISKHEFSSSQA